MLTTDTTSSKTLDAVVDTFATLPGIGRRSALRLALHLLTQPKESILSFGTSISALATDVQHCRRCGAPTEGAFCDICSDRRRDERLICVVEGLRDRLTIEQTGSFHGTYHLLGGIISPMDGKGPSDLNIPSLLQRIDTLQKVSAEPIEVILALSGSVEGETTALYLYRKLEPHDVKVTTLARGLAFGADLEYADPVTLGRAIHARISYKP